MNDGIDNSARGYDSYQMKLGDLMRGERATLGKSLLDVQRDLRIKAAYISAIENCDPTVFQTPGFIAGHVRSYARYLDLDPDIVFEMFCRESEFNGVNPGQKSKKAQAQTTGSVAPGAANSGKIAPAAANSNAFPDPFNTTRTNFSKSNDSFLSQLSGSSLASIFVLIVLILGIGFGAWMVLQDIQRVEFVPVAESPGLIADGFSSADDGLVSSQDVLTVSKVGAENLDQLYRPQELDVPVLEARDGPISIINPDNIGATVAGGGLVIKPQAEDTIASGPKVIDEAPPQVSIVAERAAWVRVSLEDGSVLFERILNAGESFRLPSGIKPPVLRAGNAGHVFVTVGDNTFGPIGDGAAVAKGVSLAGADISSTYTSISDQDQLRALENPKIITLNQSSQ